MNLHIFNPEHDIALAANKRRFTPPHAARQLRADLGFLPALWAEDGDMVLVDDVEAACESVRHIKKYVSEVRFVGGDDLGKIDFSMVPNLAIKPWGWDLALKDRLIRLNKSLECVVPSDDTISKCRDISNRHYAAQHLLLRLHDKYSRVVGESSYCQTLDEALATMHRYGQSVLKSPWSSSGRGVRYVLTDSADASLVGWMRNVLCQQGGIMVEPMYAKVQDFAVEFFVHGDGRVDYCGLSLFDTRGGAYSGSVCATENDKREMLAKYVDMALLDDVCRDIQTMLAEVLPGIYEGPLGIDMMAVAGRDVGFWLHPCVELNLRRTMGHVALALTPSISEPHRLMNIYYTDKYRLRIRNTTDNLLNTGMV